jgi:hypothetical protein
MISDRSLLLAAAAAYDPAGKPFFEAVDHALRVFTTQVDDVTVYAIEGTHDPVGWALDFVAISTEAHEVGEHASLGFVHFGFYRSAVALFPAFKDIGLTTKYAITGHSLGAALALLLGGILINRGYPPVKIGAFAPPRVGGDRFVSIVTSIPLCACRVGDDPVTDFPLTLRDFPYRQVPLTVIGRTRWPAIECHHIANYVAAFGPTKQEDVMGDTVKEIEDVVSSLQGVTPAVGALIGALIPAAGPELALIGPALSIFAKIMEGVETLKSGGTSHEAAQAVIGHTVVAIGQQLLGSVSAPAAKAAAPIAVPLKT